MSEKMRSVLGHLGIAAAYLIAFGLGPARGRYFFIIFIAVIAAVGLWVALSTKLSSRFSIIFAIALWLTIGAVIIYNGVSYQNAQRTPYANSSGPAQFFLSYIFVAFIMGLGFFIGQFAIKIRTSFTSGKKAVAPDDVNSSTP